MNCINETNFKFDHMALWGAIKRITEESSSTNSSEAYCIAECDSSGLVLNEQYSGTYVASVVATVATVVERKNQRITEVKVQAVPPLGATPMGKSPMNAFYIPLVFNRDVFVLSRGHTHASTTPGKLYECENAIYSVYNVSLVSEWFVLMFETEPVLKAQ